MRLNKWFWLLGGVSLAIAAYVWAANGADADRGGASLAAAQLHAGHGGAPAVIPLAADLNDPFLDPVALQMSHEHAGASEQTDAELAVRMNWSWLEGSPKAGEEVLLRMAISDGGGRPVPEFMVFSEKLLHLIAVSDNMEDFQHVHPVHLGGGVFELPIKFKHGGGYRLYADFQPVGMTELTRTFRVDVEGESGGRAEWAASKSLVQQAGEIEVTLHLGHVMAGMASEMTYSFRDKKTGKPLRDMEPYLGSIGHVVAIDESMEQYIHIHPLNWASSGPIATFAAAFPKAGLYKVWGQFQRAGQSFIVPFVVEIPE